MDCPSQWTYIATDDGYISASDAEDDDDGDSSEAAIDDDAMFGGAATANLRSIIVQRVLCTQPELSQQQRHNLFQTFFAIQNRRARVIIDGGSCNNLVSSDLVKKFGLTTRSISHPYNLECFNNSGKAKLTKLARIHFSVGSYQDYANFDVVPMQSSSLLLG